MIQLDVKYKITLLEAIQNQMYKTALELENYKGKPMTKERKILVKKQSELEALQHLLHMEGV